MSSAAGQKERKAAQEEKERRERERREFKEAQELESLRRAFKRIDKKGDSTIDVDELQEELDFLGHKIKPAEVRASCRRMVERCACDVTSSLKPATRPILMRPRRQR